MRTTLNFDDRLFRAAKRRAAEQGETLTKLIERAVRDHLTGPSAPERPFRMKLLIKRGTPVPGVNFDDRDMLYDRMAGRS